MIKYLCIAAVLGASSAICRAGDFGDALPLQRLEAVEKQTKQNTTDIEFIKQKLGIPSVTTIAEADGPIILGPGPTVVPLKPVKAAQPVAGPIVSPFSQPTQAWSPPAFNAAPVVTYSDPVVTYQTLGNGQTMTCVNGQCGTNSGFVQYQQPSRPGLLGRIFGR